MRNLPVDLAEGDCADEGKARISEMPRRSRSRDKRPGLQNRLRGAKRNKRTLHGRRNRIQQEAELRLGCEAISDSVALIRLNRGACRKWNGDVRDKVN